MFEKIKSLFHPNKNNHNIEVTCTFNSHKNAENDTSEIELGQSKYLKECGYINLLYWADGQKKEINYPNYFTFSYTINPYTAHRELVEQGLLELAGKDKQWNTLTVPKLKEVLKKNNLKSTGNKPDLVQRLIEHNIQAPNVELYVLSEKGKVFLNENNPWLEYHRRPQIMKAKQYKEQWETLKLRNQKVDYNSIVTPFIENKLKTISKNKFQTYKFALHEYFKLLNDKNEIEKAVLAALTIICIDLSGLNDNTEDLYRFTGFGPESFVNLPQYFIDYVSIHSEYYNPNDIKDIYSSLNLSKGAMKLNKMQMFIELALNDFTVASEKLTDFKLDKKHN